MATSLYMVYDRIAESVTGPMMTGKNDNVICRIFAEAVRDKAVLGKHPHDYKLLRLGTVEDDGTITPNAPVEIAWGADYVEVTADA